MGEARFQLSPSVLASSCKTFGVKLLKTITLGQI